MAQLLAFDDDPNMRWDALKTIGHEVKTFTDPGEALDYARSHTIDMALLGGDKGIDLIKHLREISPNFKVILFFDSPKIQDIQRALGYAPSSILFKPVVGEELDACLMRALRKGKSAIKNAFAL